jgi:2-polyprenyl-6-methoxyphenol hydroxylase-like FAD-dependent oxidoreductase
MSQATSPSPERYDVVIVGARCAGSAAAATFARAGRSVLVLERSKFPADTISSHTMFAGTIDEVRAIGALPYLRRLDPPDIRTFRMPMAGPDGAAVEYREEVPSETISSVRRYLLDQALVDMVRDLDVEVREQSEVTAVHWRGGRASGVVYRDNKGREHSVGATLVIGADGVFSTVADLVGAAQPYRWSHSPRAAMLRYVKDPIVEGPEATTVFHSRQGRSCAFSFPTTPRGETVVMFVDERASVEGARTQPEEVWAEKLRMHPALEARYGSVADQDSVKVFDELTSYFRPATGPGWALAGDAGHFKDPIIGQGMRDAMWSGRTLAEHTAALIDSPEELDRAMRRWEREREVECAVPYMLGIRESLDEADSDGLRRFVEALSNRGVPLATALGMRDGKASELLSKKTISLALLDAVRRSPNKRQTVRELSTEGRQALVGGFRLRRQRFRSSAPHEWEQPIKEPIMALVNASANGATAAEAIR